MWVFLILFTVSLFAEFVANDKPFVVVYRGEVYMPIFKAYPETMFGGDFLTEADYRDPFLAELIDAEGWMLWPPIRYHHQTVAWDLPVPAPAPPDRQHWLGTDDQARDVLARAIYGFRISVLFGFTLTIISAVIGVAAGAAQGYFGGWTDLLAQRFIEVWSGLPTLYLLIILASVVEPNFWWLLGLLLLFSWIGFVGVVRAELLRVCSGRSGTGGEQHGDHVPPPATQRNGGNHHLYAFHSGRLRYCADLPGFSGNRLTAGVCITGRTAGTGQGQPASPVAWLHRLFRHRPHVEPADFCRRSGSRRLRPS
jgi:hypothetical protein